MPVHGYKIGEHYWAGKMVTFACDPGYFLEGPTNRLCLENGNWSDVIPTCKKSHFKLIGRIGCDSAECVICSTDYFQRMTPES